MNAVTCFDYLELQNQAKALVLAQPQKLGSCLNNPDIKKLLGQLDEAELQEPELMNYRDMEFLVAVAEEAHR